MLVGVVHLRGAHLVINHQRHKEYCGGGDKVGVRLTHMFVFHVGYRLFIA